MAEQFFNNYTGGGAAGVGGANGANSVLAAAITSSQTTLTVVSGALFPTSGNFRILIDQEILEVTAVSGMTFTVVRGNGGSAAAAHVLGSNVYCILTAEGLAAFRSDLGALTGLTGAGGTTISGSAPTLTVTSPALDTTAGDINPVAGSASAGSTGKGADAGHQHVGVHSVAAGTGITLGGTAADPTINSAVSAPVDHQPSGSVTLVATGMTTITSISLPAGKWLIQAQVDLTATSGALTLQLTDGTNTQALSGFTAAGTGTKSCTPVLYMNAGAVTLTFQGQVNSGTATVAVGANFAVTLLAAIPV